MSLSIAEAELIGGFLECLSYGVYLLVFIQCMRALRRRESPPNDYLLGTAVSLFILITAHLVVDIIRNIDAYTSNTEAPDYAAAYYQMFNTWKDLLKSGLYVSITVIADAFMLYRSFVVWGGNYIVAVIPFLLLLADLGVGILWVYSLSRVTTQDNVYADTISVRIKAFYSITLVLNAGCTCLIAFKVWTIQKAVAPFVKGSQDNLSRLVAVIVESGSVYSTILVVLIASYAASSPVMFIFLNTLSPIIGIVFSSVIVRVSLGLSHGDSHSTATGNGKQMHWAVRSPPLDSGPLITPVVSLPSSVQVTVQTHMGDAPDEALCAGGYDKVKDDVV